MRYSGLVLSGLLLLAGAGLGVCAEDEEDGTPGQVDRVLQAFRDLRFDEPTRGVTTQKMGAFPYGPPTSTGALQGTFKAGELIRKDGDPGGMQYEWKFAVDVVPREGEPYWNNPSAELNWGGQNVESYRARVYEARWGGWGTRTDAESLKKTELLAVFDLDGNAHAAVIAGRRFAAFLDACDASGRFQCGGVGVWGSWRRRAPSSEWFQTAYGGPTAGDPLAKFKAENRELGVAAMRGFFVQLHEALRKRDACECRSASSGEPFRMEFLDANPQFLDGQFDFTDPRTPKKTGSMKNYLNRARFVATQAKRKVVGAVADGVSLVVLRVPVPCQGRGTFTLEGSGELYPLGDAVVPGKGKGEVTVDSFIMETTPKDQGYLACLYLPPACFGEGKTDTKHFRIRLTFKPAKPGVTEMTAARDLQVVRPAVVLVHGTYDNPDSCWRTKNISLCQQSLFDRLHGEGFQVFTVDWRESNGQRDPSSFFHNRTAVWSNKGGGREAVDAMRKRNLAATQVDIVAHSQGGVIARMYARGTWSLPRLAEDDYHFTSPHDCAETCNYHRPDNFARGDLHRIITLSTTHYGSDLCRLFEAFRYFVDTRQFLDDPIMGFWDGVETEFVLALHPQREVEIFMPSERWKGSMPWYDPARPTTKTDYLSMLHDGFWKKMDIYKDYAFTQGFRDQIPDSEGLRGVMKTQVPAHAIACVATDRDVIELNGGYYHQRLEQIWTCTGAKLLLAAFDRIGQRQDGEDLARMKREEDQLIGRESYLMNAASSSSAETRSQASPGELAGVRRRIAETRRLNAARFRSATFGNEENDCTVRASSSFGGLPQTNTTVIHGVIHGPAPQFPVVQDRIVELLKNDGTLFCPEGFPDAGGLPTNRPYMTLPGGTTVSQPVPAEPSGASVPKAVTGEAGLVSAPLAGVEITKDAGNIIFRNVNPSGAAYRAGIRDGDRVLTISKKAVDGLTPSQVKDLMTPKAGEEIFALLTLMAPDGKYKNAVILIQAP